MAFPALLFVARPKIPLRLMLGYGLTISFGQFAFYSARLTSVCRPGWLSGAAGAGLFHNRAGRFCLWRAVTGKAGCRYRAGDFGVLVLVEASLGGQHVPLVGFMLTLAAAFSWACGNIFNKKIMSQQHRPPIMSLVVWSALIPVLPFMLASGIVDGPQAMAASSVNIDATTVLSLMYLAFVATIVGYGIWGALLGRYETWRVAPLSLLVPVVGMASAALLLGERLNGLQLLGAALIMGGLYINVFGLRLVHPGAARDKSPALAGPGDIRTSGALVVIRYAQLIRFIIAGSHVIKIKRRVVMFRRNNHRIPVIVANRSGGLLRVTLACSQRH